jgi:hypothetical protein
VNDSLCELSDDPFQRTGKAVTLSARLLNGGEQRNVLTSVWNHHPSEFGDREGRSYHSTCNRCNCFVFQEKPKRFEELVCSVLSQPTCNAHRNEFTAQVVHLDSYGTSICNAYIIKLLYVQSTLVTPVSHDQLCGTGCQKWLINYSKQIITMLYCFFWVIPRGITKKKQYNIQNTGKVWNQEIITIFQTLAVFCMLCSFFGWIPGVWFLCADVSEHSVRSSRVASLMKMEHTECFQTSAHKIQTPGNHTKKE